jgi:hypothetical protein
MSIRLHDHICITEQNSGSTHERVVLGIDNHYTLLVHEAESINGLGTIKLNSNSDTGRYSYCEYLNKHIIQVNVSVRART